MSITAIDNKQVLRNYLREFSGRPKTEEMMERLISDESLKTHIRQFEAAFSAYEVIPLLIVAEGDWLACRMTFKGVHTGEFAGIPSTGRAVSSDFAIFYRFENGRIVEHRLHPDIQDLVRQLTA